MKLDNSQRFTIAVLAFALFCPLSADGSEDKSDAIESKVRPFLRKYCVDCHDDGTQEGGVSLHDLHEVNYGNAGLWQRIWEQVSLKEMPPREEDNQPSLMDRYELTKAITNELVKAHENRGDFTAHLHPLKGNHLDHDLLFNTSHQNLEPASTPARVWRLHPMEHMVRLNELIAKEPAYDPAAPGKFARGDRFVPTMYNDNKVHFGLESIVGGDGNALAGQLLPRWTQGFYAVLDAPKSHGLRDYPFMHEVNGPTATQMLGVAEKVLTFMAYGPKTALHRATKKTEMVGIVYGDEIRRPLTPVYDLMNTPGVSDARLIAAINYLFNGLTLREPTMSETSFYLEIAKESIQNLGKEKGALPGLAPIFVNHYALFRPELAESGKPDEHGRVMLEGTELVLALNHAFCYIMPDAKLDQALKDGKLKTREDVKREVTRILNDDSIRKPRILQFFREYFDYGHAADLCKDDKALKAGGRVLYDKSENQFPRWHRAAMVNHVANTDRLVELILEEDKNVFKELLTTDRVIIGDFHDTYFRNKDNDRWFVPPFRFYSGRTKYPQLKTRDGEVFPPGGRKTRKETQEQYDARKRAYEERRHELLNDLFPGEETPIHVRLAKFYRLRGDRDARYGGMVEARTLTRVNRSQRAGILTHPSWLVSHSDAMDNHAILRGKWVRERLLGDAVPDVPITVNAMLPEEPKSTLRHRMRVTREGACWRCHRKMDPLGLPFELYNHIGLYREKEQGKPVDTSGEILYSGDPELDGPVTDAIDMIQKLAASERVEQVFVRHVFRYWMGRNETLNDAPILRAAHKAYKDNGGSMKALLTSLLTSDAFLYRKVNRN